MDYKLQPFEHTKYAEGNNFCVGLSINRVVMRFHCIMIVLQV